MRNLKISDFDDLQVIQRGFRDTEKKGTSICIHCEEEVVKDDMPAHLKQHSDSEIFQTLLQADSITTFTAKEKQYLTLVFSGDDDKTIAGKMGIPHVSARRMRNEFKTQIRQAHRLLAMANLLGNKLDRQKRSESMPLHTEIPVIDEVGTVFGFRKTKRELHRDGSLHPTSLIVVIKKDPETGEPAILVVDKANKTMTLGEKDAFFIIYDVLGGHARLCDWNIKLSNDFDYNELIGKTFPKQEVMWNCARRELRRELVSPRQSDESLSFWFEDRHSGENDEGINNEITWCFLCRYQNEASTELNMPGEVRIKDDWIDSIGRTTSHTYVGRFWRIPELREEIKKSNVKAFDGLERVLKKLDDDPAAMKHIIEWLG